MWCSLRSSRPDATIERADLKGGADLFGRVEVPGSPRLLTRPEWSRPCRRAGRRLTACATSPAVQHREGSHGDFFRP